LRNQVAFHAVMSEAKTIPHSPSTNTPPRLASHSADFCKLQLGQDFWL
jgi:hypothetical protein